MNIVKSALEAILLVAMLAVALVAVAVASALIAVAMNSADPRDPCWQEIVTGNACAYAALPPR
jgi:hypothetical protein